MEWTEPRPPALGVSYYDHVLCETPLGLVKIEWKSWKQSPDYGVLIENQYLGTEYDLEDAKEVARKYLLEKLTALQQFFA